jgi:hypothetical protein
MSLEPDDTIRTSAELIEMYLEGHNSWTTFEKTNKQNLTEIDRIVDLMNSVLIYQKDDSGKTSNLLNLT